ncbi:transmembrane protein 270 [Cynocephalus volans]|uniref:transmembrane protein 270 n=1 Tax=Cynocephalus volans TaxID=110931 RepID=UPI002FCBC56B
MEAVPPVRSSLLGVLLQVARLSVLVVENRVHLYNFLLLKIILFNHWVSGLAQEARGSCNRQAPPVPGISACPLGQALRAGLALMRVPVWLVLRGPRLMWVGVLDCARGLGLALPRRSAWEWLGLCVAPWKDLLLSCLHSLMLLALLLLLLTWRLCQKAHHCSLGWLPRKNRMVLEFLVLLKRLYWWVESMAVLTSCHLAYLVTWTTCLASHLLQAAFEHTAQLAQAQEAESQESSGPLLESQIPEPLTPEAGPGLPEHGTPAE